MNIKNEILELLSKNETLSVNELVKKTSFTRAYIHRKLTELIENGKIIKTGNGKNTRYLKLDRQKIEKVISKINSFKRQYTNEGLKEDECLNEIAIHTSILFNLRENVTSIFEYAFTEIMNNAIEHSRAKYITVTAERDGEQIRFEIKDNGIGIFNNLKTKFRLKSIIDAVQDLTKGKFTTAPEKHTGEGIFFTSKISDIFVIKSYGKTLIINNILKDITVKDSKNIKGTYVTFVISAKTKKILKGLFDYYTDDSSKFNKSKIWVKLFEQSTHFISRSEAKRILNGLEKFKTIIFDFTDVKEIGQGFADEIFRVWQSSHRDIKIIPVNTNENVLFMINRVI